MNNSHADARRERINTMDPADARALFLRCCGAAKWAEAMTASRPYDSWEHMEATSESLWPALTERDWREAFDHHPKIGDISNLRTRFAGTRDWASGEQEGAATASEATLQALAEGNVAYESRFGYIFIVCATGKSADEMLHLLRERLWNNSQTEIEIAAAQQREITALRLRKL